MTKAYTIEFPTDYNDYNVEDDRLEDGTHIARQKYYKDGEVLTQTDIYYKMEDGQLERWPFKVVMYDFSGQLVVTESED